jgi:hypothetical protein
LLPPAKLNTKYLDNFLSLGQRKGSIAAVEPTGSVTDDDSDSVEHMQGIRSSEEISEVSDESSPKSRLSENTQGARSPKEMQGIGHYDSQLRQIEDNNGFLLNPGSRRGPKVGRGEILPDNEMPLEGKTTTIGDLGRYEANSSNIPVEMQAEGSGKSGKQGKIATGDKGKGKHLRSLRAQGQGKKSRMLAGMNGKRRQSMLTAAEHDWNSGKLAVLHISNTGKAKGKQSATQSAHIRKVSHKQTALMAAGNASVTHSQKTVPNLNNYELLGKPSTLMFPRGGKRLTGKEGHSEMKSGNKSGLDLEVAVEDTGKKRIKQIAKKGKSYGKQPLGKWKYKQMLSSNASHDVSKKVIGEDTIVPVTDFVNGSDYNNAEKPNIIVSGKAKGKEILASADYNFKAEGIGTPHKGSDYNGVNDADAHSGTKVLVQVRSKNQNTNQLKSQNAPIGSDYSYGTESLVAALRPGKKTIQKQTISLKGLQVSSYGSDYSYGTESIVEALSPGKGHKSQNISGQGSKVSLNGSDYSYGEESLVEALSYRKEPNTSQNLSDQGFKVASNDTDYFGKPSTILTSTDEYNQLFPPSTEFYKTVPSVLDYNLQPKAYDIFEKNKDYNSQGLSTKVVDYNYKDYYSQTTISKVADYYGQDYKIQAGVTNGIDYNSQYQSQYLVPKYSGTQDYQNKKGKDYDFQEANGRDGKYEKELGTGRKGNLAGEHLKEISPTLQETVQVVKQGKSAKKHKTLLEYRFLFSSEKKNSSIAHSWVIINNISLEDNNQTKSFHQEGVDHLENDTLIQMMSNNSSYVGQPRADLPIVIGNNTMTGL